jgi:hypothetical protein
VDPRRLSWGDWIAGAAGVLLIVSLFLPWYSANGQQVNAWQSMAFDDVILAITGALAVGAAVVVGIKRLAGFSVGATSLAIMPAVIGLIVTVYRIVSPAPPEDVSLQAGAWLALVSALAIFVGSWEGAQDEGPARRSPQAERHAAAEAMAAAELLPLPGTGGNAGSEPSGG